MNYGTGVQEGGETLDEIRQKIEEARKAQDTVKKFSADYYEHRSKERAARADLEAIGGDQSKATYYKAEADIINRISVAMRAKDASKQFSAKYYEHSSEEDLAWADWSMLDNKQEDAATYRAHATAKKQKAEELRAKSEMDKAKARKKIEEAKLAQEAVTKFSADYYDHRYNEQAAWADFKTAEGDEKKATFYKVEADIIKRIALAMRAKDASKNFSAEYYEHQYKETLAWADWRAVHDIHDQAEEFRAQAAAYKQKAEELRAKSEMDKAKARKKIEEAKLAQEAVKKFSADYYDHRYKEQAAWADFKTAEGDEKKATFYKVEADIIKRIALAMRAKDASKNFSAEYYEHQYKETLAWADWRAVHDIHDQAEEFRAQAAAYKQISNAIRVRESATPNSPAYFDTYAQENHAWAQILLLRGNIVKATEYNSVAQEHEGKRDQYTHKEDFGLFSVHIGNHGNFVLIDGKYYKQQESDRSRIFTLPKQTLGTCYFFSAMNMILNESTFVIAFINHIKSEIERSPYSRKPSDTDANLLHRRFGKDDVKYRLTMSRNAFDADEEEMKEVFDDISSNKDLFLWARNVIMYHTLNAALNDVKQGANKAYASRSSILMKDWALDKDVKNKFDVALDEVGNGGWPALALEKIFKLSGLSTRLQKMSLIATIPGSNVALCIGERAYGENFTIPNDGSYSGLYIMKGDDKNKDKTSAHANAFIRNGKQEPVIIESNGNTYTAVSNKEWWAGMKLYWNRFMYHPAYTCIVDASFTGGGDASVVLDDETLEVSNLQAAMMVPDDASVLMECDELKCDIDEDLKSAIFIVKSFIASELAEDQAGGGGIGKYPYAWAALSAVIMSMSVFGSM